MKEDIWADTQPWGQEDAPRSPLLDAKVMMVDDEPLMTDLIQAYLEDDGYANFVVTNDPRQALDLLRREEPSVLLLDLMMPHISGFELLELIRGDRKLRYTPVIVLTAATSPEAKLRALQLGVTDFLSKPVDESELVLRLRNTLAFHQYHRRLVEFDSVTGLPNQQPFDRCVQELIDRRELAGGMVALFSITVPQCRQLRDSAGQHAADDLARTIARRLERLASDEFRQPTLIGGAERNHCLARLGTVHFAMTLQGLADADAVEYVAKRVLAQIAEPMMVGEHEVEPGAWIGIALSPADGTTSEDLRKGAALAVAQAQQQTHPTFLFASAELNARSLERLALGSALRGAAQRGELRLHYQPKLDVASNRIIGAEALVRWQHPELGLVPPLRFISLAEELGLINGIGRWVMQTACRDAAQWVRDGLGELKIAINVAKPQFQLGSLRDELQATMTATGLRPRQLVVELTESMLMDDVDNGRALMHEMKALGVTLSIDDFGTGYSSLSYLKSFPLDELKIDRSFVTDLPDSASDVAIVRAIIDLGHSLGMSVIAEGIETDEQRECMQLLGCDNYQGFLFSKPVPVDDFVALLKNQR
ncbi:EAL domain-containing protein [Comamonadaceae bacterium G21597-S1]|nr:EAL domain-containing protein [Comamonadaceae bacterium G21597-S1]